VKKRGNNKKRKKKKSNSNKKSNKLIKEIKIAIIMIILEIKLKRRDF